MISSANLIDQSETVLMALFEILIHASDGFNTVKIAPNCLSLFEAVQLVLLELWVFIKGFIYLYLFVFIRISFLFNINYLISQGISEVGN